MSVDQMNLVASREPISMRFRAAEVEVVPAKPGISVSRIVKKDILECGLSDADLGDRLVWRATVNASQLLLTPETG